VTGPICLATAERAIFAGGALGDGVASSCPRSCQPASSTSTSNRGGADNIRTTSNLAKPGIHFPNCAVVTGVRSIEGAEAAVAVLTSGARCMAAVGLETASLETACLQTAASLNAAASMEAAASVGAAASVEPAPDLEAAIAMAAAARIRANGRKDQGADH